MTYPTPAVPGPSALTIITKKTPGNIGALMKPSAVINGHQVPLEWGTNVIPAPPGVHQIQVYCQYLWKIGKAEITVDNTREPAQPVYYASPWTNFNKGAIAFHPVKNPGGLGLGIIVGGLILLMLLVCIGGALASNG